MDFKNKLLKHFNLTEDDYLKLIVKLKDIRFNIDEFIGIEVVKDIIMNSINNHESIMIYGDYDVDGIMSTSIMYNTLNKLGVKNIGYYIPSRVLDGYGINIGRAKQIKDKNYKLVITVDNGVKQNEAIDFLKINNIKVITIDHHIYDNNRPIVDGFIHPHNKSHVEELCASYVAFMLSIKLLNHIDYDLLTYASLATISDMMPLSNLNNRNIVRLGLKYLEKHQEHVFHLLHSKEIDEEAYGYYIAPKINAYGRIKEDISINKVVKLFIDTPLYLKKDFVNELETINNYRKNEVKKAYEKVLVYDEDGLIVIKEDLQDGLVGLLASRFLNQKHKPVIALNLKNGIYKGSARSLKNTPLDLFFEENKELFITSGGHELAGGLSFKEENFEIVKTKFFEFVKLHPFIENQEEIIFLNKEEITLTNYQILKSFSPFGMEFKEPKFSLTLNKNELINLGKHIKAILNNEANLIGFNIDYNMLNETITAIGRIRLDTYNQNKVQFICDEII